jgi:hypothetical protein
VLALVSTACSDAVDPITPAPGISASHGAGIGDPLYPDLQTLTPDNFSISTVKVRGKPEVRLLFDNEVMNLHTGPLELVPTTDNCTTGNGGGGHIALQRIYRDSDGDGGFTRGSDISYDQQPAGCMTFHKQHQHWHFNDFSLFQLKSGGTVIGQTSTKMTFCVADVYRRANLMSAGSSFSPAFRYYTQCSRTAVQGLSVGWGDLYDNGTPGQYLVITAVPDGTYCFVSTADPFFTLSETDDTNNVASRAITLSTGGDGRRQVSVGAASCE